MSGKLLLFLSAESFRAYLWVNKTLVSEQHFADTAQGREQFVQFLLTQPNTPAYLLTDFIEEDFRHETVPHLRGSERSGMMQRKFEQYYRNTPFRQALLLQRSSEGRRDDDVLFSALTNPAHISPWLNILLANSIPLAGIYSVPNISAPLVKDINSDHLLLLSWEKHAGLRQTYFNHKRLHFSRLVSISSSKPFGKVVAIETARTEHYLDSLSLLPHGQVLNVVMVCHAEQRKEIENELINTDAMHFSYLDIQTLGKKLNATFDYFDSDATPLFLHLLATKPPASQYASAEHKHFFSLWNFRRNILGLSAALMLCGLIWGMTKLWRGYSLNSDYESRRGEIQQLSQLTQQIIQNFPNTPGFSKALATASDMKTAVQLVRKLDQHSPHPKNILANLSTTLNVFPNIHIDKLTWSLNAIVSANPNSPEHVILLKGVLQEWSGNYRDGLAYLEDFQQALSRHGHVVTPVSLPLDVSASGSIAINENINKPAQFELKILWRPQP